MKDIYLEDGVLKNILRKTMNYTDEENRHESYVTRSKPADRLRVSRISQRTWPGWPLLWLG